MNNKKTKFKLSATRISAVVLVALIGLVGLGLYVKAYSTNKTSPATVVENMNVENYNNQVTNPEIQDEVLSASAIDYSARREIDVNGDITFHITQPFQDATTTILAITDPFLMATSSASDVVVTPTADLVNGLGQTGATSTVELVRLNITGAATSTYTVTCGASATNGANGAGTQAYSILSSDSITTSTLAIVENNLTSSYGTSIGGGSVPKIRLGPTYPYLVCAVSTSYTGAFTEVTNTFDGTATVRISRTRQ